MNKVRIAVGVLTLSASAFVGIVSHEGYTDEAVIPVKGDVPTFGFGSTVQGDGKTRVQMGDTITPVRALHLAINHLSVTEKKLKDCIGNVPMHQHEWDAVVSWTYNVGEHAACKSTLVRKLKAGDYEGACNELPRWNKVQGREVRGLSLRRERERQQCLGLTPSDNSQRR
jgi:lysozyme